jgi:hypothetical protein
MDKNQDQKGKWAATGIKLALSFAALFPVYAFVYITFPASIAAVYVVSSVLVALFAPWDAIRKRFEM